MLAVACADERESGLDATTGYAPACELHQTEFGCNMDLTCSVAAVNTCSPLTEMPAGDAACVIARLRGQSPARVQISTDPDAVFCGWLDDIHIVGDGTAIMRRTMPGSIDPEMEVRRVAIREPSFFDACAESDDPALLQECLSDWFEPSCVGTVCCPVPTAGDTPVCSE